MKTKIWYYAAFNEIKKVKILKETKEFIWPDISDSRKQKKLSFYMSYFKTFSEAKLFLLNKKKIKLKDAERILKEAQIEFQDVKNIKEKNIN